MQNTDKDQHDTKKCSEETRNETMREKEPDQMCIRDSRSAGREIKILTLADKLSNIRSTARDYLLEGENIWERFNVKEKDKHAWYYNSMVDLLKELGDYPEYQEYVRLCRTVFGGAPGGPSSGIPQSRLWHRD